MGLTRHQNSLMALTLLKEFPQSIRESLLHDPSFRNATDLKADGEISFGTNTSSFQQSKLIECVRALLADRSLRPVLPDMSGNDWILEVDADNRMALLRGEERVSLPDFSAFSPYESERVNTFEKWADEVGMSDTSLSMWGEKLVLGPLEDEEIELLHNDIDETPRRVAEKITSQLRQGSSTVGSLVPHSKRYYSRLVGPFDSSQNISEYFEQEGRKHLLDLLEWRPYEGLLFSLLLASHPFFSKPLIADSLGEENILRAFEWVTKNGDRMSQVGAVEIWLSDPSMSPKAEPLVRSIIQEIGKDNDEPGGRMSLLSALIVFVDGELARAKVLHGTPPFYRRLASIAHASLIERCIVASNVDRSSFSDWALSARGVSFYLQTLTDLRCEPRWQPDYISPTQLKAELVGRIYNSAQALDVETKNVLLLNLLGGDDANAIEGLAPVLLSFLPGPLEGGIFLQNEAPAEVIQVIEEQLNSETIQLSSFTAIVNAALFFKLDTYLAQLAVKTLRSVKESIRIGDDKDVVPVLRGLATVAAITRSVELAEEVRVLTRRCRHQLGKKLSLNEVVPICLSSAAANSDIAKWSECVGEWLTELAFQAENQEERQSLHATLGQLIQLVPELWLTCGRAEAATTV